MNGLALIPAEQLRELVSEAVEAALAAHDGKPALLDRAGLARALSCSASHIDSLRRAGLPELRLGDAPRFELARCLEWLRNQKGTGT